MTIRLTNAGFESVNEDSDFASVDDAYRHGVRAALDIAVSEVSAGVDSAIVEVSVLDGGHRLVSRGAVAVSTARILANPLP